MAVRGGRRLSTGRAATLRDSVVSLSMTGTHPIVARRRTIDGAIRGLALVAIATVAGLAPAAGADAKKLDRAYRTPIAHGAAAARTSVSSAQLARNLARTFKRAGKSGAFVMDAGTGRVLFRRAAGRPRILASNTKIFTTTTAIGRFGADTSLQTEVWSADEITDGISQGLYLKGSGDPTLNTAGLTRLAERVRAAGLLSVTGPLRYDDTFLDRSTGVPQHGIRAERIGTLSALTIDSGGPSDPAKLAAQRFDDALRKAGVSISQSVSPATTPPESAGARQVAELASPTLAELARLTNVPSNNFLAEMLLKDVGGAFGSSGSTASGISVVKSFAAERGANFQGENGSGLSRSNRSSPAGVGRLLASMLKVDPGVTPEEQREQERRRDGFVDSLAVAGRSGTLAHRMRGTAARGRCHAKTGTLNRVSALSGYCFSGPEDAEHAVVFSVLMNSVDVNRAHVIQDRMAALIARYRP
jgi:D-alanyl-D-alanine carboxypeptidase/D-alanyl-D-alanine-endopeptidase (penicillin-binding protein 4)